MSLITPGKRFSHRRYSYEPRYYNPAKDERLKRKIRVKSLARRRRSPLGLIIFGILFAMALYVYLNLG